MIEIIKKSVATFSIATVVYVFSQVNLQNANNARMQSRLTMSLYNAIDSSSNMCPSCLYFLYLNFPPAYPFE